MINEYCHNVEMMIKLYSTVTFDDRPVGVVEVILSGALTGFYFDGYLTGYNVDDFSAAYLHNIGDTNRHVIIYSIN